MLTNVHHLTRMTVTLMPAATTQLEALTVLVGLDMKAMEHSALVTPPIARHLSLMSTVNYMQILMNVLLDFTHVLMLTVSTLMGALLAQLVILVLLVTECLAVRYLALLRRAWHKNIHVMQFHSVQ